MIMDFNSLVEYCRKNKPHISLDSRKLTSGNIFVAIPGSNDDGAKYINEALGKGASGIVCRPEAAISMDCNNAMVIPHPDPQEAAGILASASFGNSSSPLKIIGITGTNGKTTCTYLLEHLFVSNGKKTGVLGTISWRWPGHCQTATLTTPDVVSTHEFISAMLSAGCEYAVMEVSSHALAQKRVAGINFTAAAFTNLTQDHLDFHKDMEEYFSIKARLFLSCPYFDKKMSVNMDDEWGRQLLSELPTAIPYGINKPDGHPEGLFGEILSMDDKGLRMRMSFRGRKWELVSPLVGEFNAHNLLLAQAVGLQLGFSPEDMQAFSTFSGVPGRMERIGNAAGLNIFVDYAHTPDALINVLKTLRKTGFSRILTVFGCGGNRDRAKRPLMGQAVALNGDIAFVTSDNPRFEDPQEIINDILPGLSGASQVFIEKDRRKATEMALQMLRPGDALLIAGKGHEDYQIINGTKSHYSDQEVVRELLHCA